MIDFKGCKKNRKENEKVYKDFFENNDLVVSTNANFFWAGEYGVVEGGPICISSFPRKVFLGFSKIQEKKVVFNSYFYGDLSKNDKYIFEECSGSVLEDVYGEEKFQKWYDFLIKQGFDFGLKIDILAEIPIDSAAGSQGNLAYLFSLASNLFLEKITKEDVLEWGKMDLNTRIKNKKYLETLYLSWSLESFFNDYTPSGAHSFAASLFEKKPVVFYKEGEISDDFTNSFKNSNIKFTALEMPTQKKGLNFDVAVIFSGKTKVTGKNVVKTLENLKKRSQCRKDLLDFIESADFLPKSFKQTDLKKTYFETSQALTWEVIYNFKKVLQGNSAFEKEFFEKVDKYQNIFSLLGIFEENDSLLKVFHQELKKLNIFFKPVGSGGGGIVLLLDHYGELESKIGILKNSLSKVGLFLEVYFFSNIDGWEVEGPKIEQFLSKGIKTEQIKGRIFKGIVYDCAQNKREEIIVSDFEQFIKKNEFVIDLDSKKLFVKGKKITSDDLHSAKVAVEILEKLINNDFHMLSAEQISVPSYRDRYEIQSKVISPLIKLVKEKLGKKMPLEIKGELSRFNLKLSKANLKIMILMEVI